MLTVLLLVLSVGSRSAREGIVAGSSGGLTSEGDEDGGKTRIECEWLGEVC